MVFWMKVFENRADHLNNNLILQEISILIFFQFYCKLHRNQSQIVVETTSGVNFWCKLYINTFKNII